MIRAILATALLTVIAAPGIAEARSARTPTFISRLNHNGVLSAGWVQVLPVLATACNFRLDNSKLTDQLVDLSRETGNVSYTRDLYTKLYMIENRHAQNEFVSAWTANFDGRQKEACDTAAALWGDSGHQFPGVLKEAAAN